MNRVVFYTILLLSAGHFTPVGGQDSLTIELSFQKSDFYLVSTGEDLYRIETTVDSYFYSDALDQPAIPYRSLNILVPAGADLIDFDFTYESGVYSNGILLGKNNIPISFSSNKGTNLNRAETAFSGSFPQQVLKYNSKEMMRGYTWFNFTIAPFLYDSQSGNLSLIQHMDIHLKYKQKQDLKILPGREEHLIQSVQERVENPIDMPLFYTNKEQTLLKSGQDKLDYLIITTQALADSFQPLIEWKQRKGLKAEIITIDEIYSRYNEATPQLDIKRLIHEYYKERNLTWVLLGGDHMIVPVQACFGTAGIDLDDNTIPTDLFYACFDKSFDWNGTIDDKIGEPYFDYVDVLPEVFIARAPVHNAEQVEVFVRKSMDYELFTPQKDFAEKILLSGVKSWNVWDGKSDNHHRNEQMYKQFLKSGLPVRKYGFYDTGTDFQWGQNYQVTTSNLSDQLNSGYSIFHFAGHGNATSILMEQGSNFSLKEASSLHNESRGVMLSSSCDINAFDINDPCLSEALMRNPNGGCVAFWGSSRDAWDLPELTSNLGPSFSFNAKFMENLYKKGLSDKSYSFAALTSMAKASLSRSSTGAYWFLQYAVNAMGDPELPIYSQDPSVFDNVRIYSWQNKLTVNTGGVDRSRICITSEDLEEGYQVVAEGVSTFTFENLPETYQVTITKHNYIPYIYKSVITSDNSSDFISGIRIYPNPAADVVNIEFTQQNGLVRVYDLSGNIHREEEITFGSNRLSISDLSQGTYILNIITDKGTEHLKLIKY